LLGSELSSRESFKLKRELKEEKRASREIFERARESFEIKRSRSSDKKRVTKVSIDLAPLKHQGERVI
jgi:hypothetical protein